MISDGDPDSNIAVVTMPHGATVEIKLIELVYPAPIPKLENVENEEYLKQYELYPFERVTMGAKSPLTITRLWPGCKYEITVSKHGYVTYSEMFTAKAGPLEFGHVFEPLPITDNPKSKPVQITDDIEKDYKKPILKRAYSIALRELIRSFDVFPWGNEYYRHQAKRYYHDPDYLRLKQLIQHFKCDSCEDEFTPNYIKNMELPQYLRYHLSRRQIIRGKFYCRKCAEHIKKSIKYTSTNQQNVIAESLNIDPINCNVVGTCEVLKAHHRTFKDDDQRLRTDFLIKTICGDDKLQKYQNKKSLNQVDDSPNPSDKYYHRLNKITFDCNFDGVVMKERVFAYNGDFATVEYFISRIGYFEYAVHEGDLNEQI